MSYSVLTPTRNLETTMTNIFDALFGIGATADERATAQAESADYWRDHAAAEAARVAAFNTPAPRAIPPHCGRCGGSGYLPSFQHIKGGACFACN
jgi:hypothetical protein